MVQTQSHGCFSFVSLPDDMGDARRMGYTSLKDLLPASPPPMPPTMRIRVDSWRDIPIKDPLVQCAAWAYLQPVAEVRDDGGGLLLYLKKMCCGLFGCFNDVMSVVARRWLGEEEINGNHVGSTN